MSRSLLVAVACGVTLSTRLIAAAPPAPERPDSAAVETSLADRTEPARGASPGEAPELRKLPVLQTVDAVDADEAGRGKALQEPVGPPAAGVPGERENRVNRTSSNKATTTVTTENASSSVKSVEAACRTGCRDADCHSCLGGGCRKHGAFLSWLKKGFDHYGEHEHPNKCHPCQVLFGGAHIECGMTTGNLIPHYPYYPPFHGYYYFRPYNIQNVRDHRAIIHRLGGTRHSPYSTEMFESVYAANENTDYPEPESQAAMQQLPRVTPRLPDFESLVN